MSVLTARQWEPNAYTAAQIRDYNTYLTTLCENLNTMPYVIQTTEGSVDAVREPQKLVGRTGFRAILSHINSACSLPTASMGLVRFEDVVSPRTAYSHGVYVVQYADMIGSRITPEAGEGTPYMKYDLGVASVLCRGADEVFMSSSNEPILFDDSSSFSTVRVGNLNVPGCGTRTYVHGGFCSQLTRSVVSGECEMAESIAALSDDLQTAQPTQRTIEALFVGKVLSVKRLQSSKRYRLPRLPQLSTDCGYFLRNGLTWAAGMRGKLRSAQ